MTEPKTIDPTVDELLENLDDEDQSPDEPVKLPESIPPLVALGHITAYANSLPRSRRADSKRILSACANLRTLLET